MIDKILAMDKILSGEVYFLTNKKSGRMMDVEGARTTNGTRMIIYDRNNNANQQFKLKEKAGDEWEITPMHAVDSAMDVSGSSAASGASVQIYADNNSAAQRFRFQRNTDGSYKILTKASAFTLAVTASDGKTVNCTPLVQGTPATSGADWYIERK